MEHLGKPREKTDSLLMEQESDFRSGSKQISDGFHDIYKKMTDPEEREKEKLKIKRKENVQEQSEDCGL